MSFRGFEQVTPEVLRSVFGLPPFATLTIPDDPEWLALILCRDHLDCADHVRGHAAFVEQAERLLTAMRGEK